MNVVRHHHKTDHDKSVILPHLFQNLQEEVPALSSCEPRLAMITTAIDEVQIVMAVITLQAFWHSLTLRAEIGVGLEKTKTKSQEIHNGNARPASL
jgi:hypothetical protein